jgi:hypothetical protein
MPSESTLTHASSGGEARPATLIWIDAREASIVRWRDAAASVARIESDVPPHHRDSIHPRHHESHPSDVREPLEGGESRRLEHLAAFIRVVVSRLPADDDLTILGPGTVREDLIHAIRDDDRLHHRSRQVLAAPADRMTDRQLIARARSIAGDPPPRQTPQRASCAPGSRATRRRRDDFADDLP